MTPEEVARVANCKACGAVIQLDWRQRRRGYGFCSLTCGSRYNQIIATASRKRSIADRLDRFTTKTTGTDCWAWTGFKHRGYGRLNVRGLAVGAHRLSFERHCGAIPSGMTVLHKCDNPECTNPSHLMLGTNEDNNRDRDLKGRAAIGSRSGAAKLTECQVMEIKRLDPRSWSDRRSVGQRYGVGECAVRAIMTGRTWKHVNAG